MNISDLIDHLAPTIGVIATGWFGMKASKSANLSKSQFGDLKNELDNIHDSVEVVQQIGEANSEKINELNDKLLVHDEAHLVTMYLRLERGYTTVHNSDVIHKMHSNYKKLGGNGYIDALYKKYINLEVRN